MTYVIFQVPSLTISMSTNHSMTNSQTNRVVSERKLPSLPSLIMTHRRNRGKTVNEMNSPPINFYFPVLLPRSPIHGSFRALAPRPRGSRLAVIAEEQ